MYCLFAVHTLLLVLLCFVMYVGSIVIVVEYCMPYRILTLFCVMLLSCGLCFVCVLCCCLCMCFCVVCVALLCVVLCLFYFFDVYLSTCLFVLILLLLYNDCPHI